MRLLVAEDHPTSQVVATRLLQQLGCRAQIVANGVEVIAALGRASFDILLMDCQMPQMDGLEATRRIRQGEAGILHAAIPIIALTANAVEGDRERYLTAGMSDYLSKPIRLKDLARILDRWAALLFTDKPEPRSEEQRPATDAPLAGQIPDSEALGGNVSQATDAKIHDRAAFLCLAGGDEALARRIVGGFLTDLPEMLTGLNSAVHGRSSRRAAALARRLRGAAKGLAAQQLGNAAQQMELAAAADDKSKMRELLDRLDTEALALIRRINA